MHLKHCQVNDVMSLFVSEVHYAILLYLYESFLLRGLMFSLNVKQLPQNSCEIIILPNYIKLKNYLLINPSEFLQNRENSSSQEPPPFQCWVSYWIPYTSCKSVLDAEEAFFWGIAFSEQIIIKTGHMCKSSGNPVSSRGIWIDPNIQSGSALDFSRTKANKAWHPTQLVTSWSHSQFI